MFEDTLEHFRSIKAHGGSLRSRMRVTFVNEHGIEEAGIDGGGLFKEFMDTINKRVFDVEVRTACAGVSNGADISHDGAMVSAVWPVGSNIQREAAIPQSHE